MSLKVQVQCKGCGLVYSKQKNHLQQWGGYCKRCNKQRNYVRFGATRRNK